MNLRSISWALGLMLAGTGCFSEPSSDTGDDGSDSAAASTSDGSTGAAASTAGAVDTTAGGGGESSEGGNPPGEVVTIYVTDLPYDGNLAGIDPEMDVVDIVDVECASSVVFRLAECVDAVALINLPGFPLDGAIEPDLPIYSPDGTFVAGGPLELLASPDASLVEANVVTADNALFWTGGVGLDGENCIDWTNDGEAQGITGDGSSTSATWFGAGGPRVCSEPRPLLCACW